jgi:hypothetical protein
MLFLTCDLGAVIVDITVNRLDKYVSNEIPLSSNYNLGTVIVTKKDFNTVKHN